MLLIVKTLDNPILTLVEQNVSFHVTQHNCIIKLRNTLLFSASFTPKEETFVSRTSIITVLFIQAKSNSNSHQSTREKQRHSVLCRKVELFVYIIDSNTY